MAFKEHGEGVEGEDDGGHNNADHGEHCNNPRPDGSVGLLEKIPDLSLKLPDLAGGELVLVFSEGPALHRPFKIILRLGESFQATSFN